MDKKLVVGIDWMEFQMQEFRARMAAFKPREAIKFRKSIHPEYKDQSHSIYSGFSRAVAP